MDNIIQTRDFYYAAFLVASGIKLHSHSKVNGSTLFNFMNDSRAQEANDSYFSMNATIEPMTYGLAMKSLKSVIHSYDTNTYSQVTRNVSQKRKCQ